LLSCIVPVSVLSMSVLSFIDPVVVLSIFILSFRA
jgi:hypothetical protein